MRCLSCDDDPELVLYGGEPVWHGDAVIGRLLSAGYGYSAEKHLGLVYLPSALGEAGTELEVEVFGTRHAMIVEPGPVHDPMGSRMKS